MDFVFRISVLSKGRRKKAFRAWKVFLRMFFSEYNLLIADLELKKVVKLLEDIKRLRCRLKSFIDKSFNDEAYERGRAESEELEKKIHAALETYAGLVLDHSAVSFSRMTVSSGGQIRFWPKAEELKPEAEKVSLSGLNLPPGLADALFLHEHFVGPVSLDVQLEITSIGEAFQKGVTLHGPKHRSSPRRGVGVTKL